MWRWWNSTAIKCMYEQLKPVRIPFSSSLGLGVRLGAQQHQVDITFVVCHSCSDCPCYSTVPASSQVVSRGQLKEFDTPYQLLQNPRSQLRRMVEKTGPSASRKLHQMALDAHLRQKKLEQQASLEATKPSRNDSEFMLRRNKLTATL